VEYHNEDSKDPLNLREFREVPDDQQALSPVMPEPQSRPQTPESPEQPRRMAEGSGTGGSRPHLLTTEMLQILLAARYRPPQNSYPKLWDPEPFEGEKAKFKTFLS